MKKGLLYPVFLLMFLMIWTNFSSAAVEIDGKKGDPVIEIKTDTYEVHWKTGAQMGYMIAFAEGEPVFEAMQGRRLYHSANYAGWKDWGSLVDFKILDQTRTMAKLEFVSDDGASKEYICVATFWDGTPLIKHEVSVKAKKAVVSFSDGHEPMYEVRSPIKGRNKWDSKGDNGPFAHAAFWTKGGVFSALYATDPQVMARNFPGWQADGRMDLDHKNLGVQLKKGSTSEPIIYWVAFGTGGEKEAHDLAKTVAEVKDGDIFQAVDANEKLSITWGAIKSSK